VGTPAQKPLAWCRGAGEEQPAVAAWTARGRMRSPRSVRQLLLGGAGMLLLLRNPELAVCVVGGLCLGGVVLAALGQYARQLARGKSDGGRTLPGLAAGCWFQRRQLLGGLALGGTAALWLLDRYFWGPDIPDGCPVVCRNCQRDVGSFPLTCTACCSGDDWCGSGPAWCDQGFNCSSCRPNQPSSIVWSVAMRYMPSTRGGAGETAGS
jgi:hypothetical protein